MFGSQCSVFSVRCSVFGGGGGVVVLVVVIALVVLVVRVRGWSWCSGFDVQCSGLMLVFDVGVRC